MPSMTGSHVCAFPKSCIHSNTNPAFSRGLNSGEAQPLPGTSLLLKNMKIKKIFTPAFKMHLDFGRVTEHRTAYCRWQ